MFSGKWGRFGGDNMESPSTTSARDRLSSPPRGLAPSQVVPTFQGSNARSFLRPNGDSTSGFKGQTTPASMSGRIDRQMQNLQATGNDVEEVVQQIAEWDNEMDTLDKKQEQLLNDQWRLLRGQIGTVMGALSEMRQEMIDLKNNVLTKEMESVIQKMIDAHDSHDQNHAGMADRIKFLETALGESADQHDNHATHKATMETRLEYMEGLMGDNADKHEDLLKKLGECAAADNHATLEERTSYLESFLGESADKHAKDLKDAKGGFKEHATTMETRLEYIEGLLGDSSDKHASELATAQSQLKDLHAAIQSCAKAEHHSSIEERVNYLEKFLGESSDQHEKDLADHKNAHFEHKTTMETRLEYVEGLLGDSADKHAKEIEAAHSKLSDLHEVIQQCAKSEHHNSLEQRMDYLENFLGESADKHDNQKKDHEDHKTTMETRLEYIEGLLGDSSDKHAKEINEAKGRLGDLHAAISKCAQHDHHSTLEERVNYLEQLQGDSADKHAAELESHKNSASTHKTAADKRMELLEKRLSGHENKSLTDMESHKSGFESHKSAMERQISELVNKHLNHENAVDNKHSNHLASMSDLKGAVQKNEQRINAHERALNDVSEKTGQRMTQVEAAQLKVTNDVNETANQIRDEKMKVRDLFTKLDQLRSSHEGSTKNAEHRLVSLEGQLMEGGFGTEFMKEMDQRIHYIQEDEKRARDMLESSMKEQVRLEHSAIHSQSSQIKEQWDREARARQAYMESYKDLLAAERKARDSCCGQLDQRVQIVEYKLAGEEPPVHVVQQAPRTILVQQQAQYPGTTIVQASGAMSPRIGGVVQGSSISVPMPVGTTRHALPPSSISRMTSVGTLPGTASTFSGGY